MTQSSFPKKNRPGRVGIKRRRPTTNQALKAHCSELETRLNATVPQNELADARECIRLIAEATDKSRTGVAHKVNEIARGFLAGVA